MKVSTAAVRSRRSLLGLVVALLLLALSSVLWVSPVVSAAKDGDVIKTGSCTGGGTYKLKLSPQNGKLEIEFEVEHKASQTWQVRIRRRGAIIFKGPKTTGAVSKSFTTRLVNGPGTAGQIRATATRPSGQSCVAVATFQ